MASGARKITVEFIGDDKSLSKTANSVEGTTSRLGSRMSKVGKIAALGLAGGAVAAGKALFDMGKAAAEDQQSTVQLANAMQKNAHATKEQIAQTESWITAQGKAYGVADDKLRPALSNLVRATHDVGKSQKLASLAMDISAGTGKDLGAVSLALSKAYNGNVGALGRLGVKTKDATGKTMSFHDVQKELSTTFGGAAKKNADTFSGRMQRLSVMFQETKEAIGYKLLPVAEKFAGWFINTAIPNMSKFITYMQAKFGPTFEHIRDVVLTAVAKLTAVFKQNLPQIVSIVKSAVDILQSLWQRFGGAVTQYTKSTLDNVIRVLRGAFNIVAGIFKTVSALLHGDWKGAWDGIKQTLSGAVQVVVALVRQMFNILRGLFRIGWDAIKGIVSGVWSGIEGIISAGARSVVNGVRAIPGKIRALAGAFRTVGTALINAFVDGLSKAAGVVGKIASGIWNALKGMINGAIDKLNSSLEFSINKGPVHIHINPPDIPHLAKGGVVKARPGGVLARIGEGGYDEAVVPLAGPYAPKMASAASDFTATAPLVLQLDAKTVWQGMLQMKRRDGIVSMGLA